MEQEHDRRLRVAGGPVKDSNTVGFDPLDGGRRHISIRRMTHDDTSRRSPLRKRDATREPMQCDWGRAAKWRSFQKMIGSG